MTREQKKQRGKRKLAYLFLAGVFLATLLVLLSLLTVTVPGSTEPVPEEFVPEESGQQAVVCVFAVTVDKPRRRATRKLRSVCCGTWHIAMGG